MCFNPRTPRGVRPLFYPPKIAYFVFQSTHPSRGATIARFSPSALLPVSIHAPLAGCDKGAICWTEYTLVSIHAPLAGCDYRESVCGAFDRRFNPRTPRGVRHSASARCCLCQSFNPRTPRGVRPIADRRPPTSTSFNPRTPRGVRLLRLFRLLRLCRFNPRTPRGVRLKRGGSTSSQRRFQSTHPSRGATMTSSARMSRSCFNPRTPRGVRLLHEWGTNI